MVRAFIAIDFPDEVIKEVARIQDVFGNKVRFTGKMTELENLHLTLKFLGEIDEEKVSEVRKRLSGIEFGEFEVKLGRVGAFAYKGNPKIVWIKVEGKEIYDLQKKIDSSLKDLFKVEENFKSHLTLARLKYVKDKPGFKEYLESLSVKKIKFKVNSFRLFSSELRQLGPVYRVIEEYKSK